MYTAGGGREGEGGTDARPRIPYTEMDGGPKVRGEGTLGEDETVSRSLRILIVTPLLAAATGCGTSSSGADTTAAEPTGTDAATTAATAAATTSAQPADPWGLTTIELPGTVEEIAEVFDGLPADLAGFTRIDPGGGEHLVDYGEGGPSLFFQGGESLVGMDGQPTTPAEWLPIVVESGEMDLLGSDLEGEVVWVHGSAEADDELEYFVMCGDADGSALFVFTASSLEDLDALVGAFVEVARG
jgi:hypothetical protein